MTALIRLKNVSKTFRLDSGADLPAVRDVNLTLEEGDFVALLGPSGSGKSTCLRMMAGLIPQSSGEVVSNGSPLSGLNRDVALVFQSFALFPWETVYSNVAMALTPLKLPVSSVRSRVEKAIDLVGLEGFEEAYPRELSGGMKQRVGIARALVMNRPILFLDEPFSALDVLTADILRTEVVRIFLERKTSTRAILIVTHNIQEAVLMAKRILVMGTNPGHIRSEVKNDLPYPRDDQSLSFQRIVKDIHALITETYMPDTAAPKREMGKKWQIESFPNAHVNQVIGLLEHIEERGGTVDVFELAAQIGKDFGTTLYMVKAAELLDLVDTPKQLVVLTDGGHRFAKGDINIRKKLLHQLFGNLRLVQMVADMVRLEGDGKMPIHDLNVVLKEWLPNENPKELADTLISWGRFAEYFGYNDDTKEVYLDVGKPTA